VFNPLDWLLSLFSLDIAIDLGTANTLVNVRGRGIVINEPSWVAIDKRTRRPLAIGQEARQMVGRTPANIIAIRPLRDGVISEFEITQAMLEYFIGKAHEQTLVPVPRPRVIVGIPSGVTEVEKRAVFDATLSAGAREALLIEEPMAAAIGAGLPITETRGSMIVDIGGGTTEVAIFSMGGIIISRSIRIAGDEMDEAIVEYMRRHFSLRIGEQSAEHVKIEVGSAFPLEQELTAEVSGLDTISGVPRKAVVTSEEIREALRAPIEAILACIKTVIEHCQPELVADLADTGLVLTGGGALLRGLVAYMNEQLGIPVRVADDPLTTVARGTAICLEHLSHWRHSLETADKDV
jgi:rod shape-determining protein MreB and related proteins